MVKRKISVTTGSRAEYGILRPVLKEIQKSKHLELYLIVAGMHLSRKHGYTLNEIKKDCFKIYSTVPMLSKENTNYGMTNSLGKGIIEFSRIYKKLQPDINIILGDRDEAFASAISSSHMNIPNAHIHGGDKTKAGIDEYNRHAITKISNIHFAATQQSKKRILKLGENPKYVFFTGSPSIDEITKQGITNKNALRKKFKINFIGEEIIMLHHPVTTEIDKSVEEVKTILEAIKEFKKNTIVIAPNSDAGSDKILNVIKEYTKKYSFINTYKNISRSYYLGLLNNAGVLIGNSSSGLIEAGYFNIRIIDIGIRQLGREHGNNVIRIKNISKENIEKTISKSLKLRKKKSKRIRLYGNGNASNKIVKVLKDIKIDEKLIKKQIFY